jgi:hypothetical protein
MCVAGLVNVSGEAVELGFLIGKPYWKHGYATYWTVTGDFVIFEEFVPSSHLLFLAP